MPGLSFLLEVGGNYNLANNAGVFGDKRQLLPLDNGPALICTKMK
jgi:hypothetical protein